MSYLIIAFPGTPTLILGSSYCTTSIHTPILLLSSPPPPPPSTPIEFVKYLTPPSARFFTFVGSNTTQRRLSIGAWVDAIGPFVVEIFALLHLCEVLD